MSSIQSHPTTSTSGPVPQPASNTLSSSTAQSSTTGSDTTSTITDPSLPEQRHAGKVGYGPNYQAGASLEDKIAGIKEEIKGKITRNPDRVQHGRELYSGEEKRKKLTGEDEPNPFEKAEDDKSTDPANAALNQNQTNNPSTDSGPGTQSTTSTDTSASQIPSETQRPGNPGNKSRDPDVTFQPTAKANPAGMAVNQGHGTGAKEQAATIAPEGTKDAEIQRRGGAEDGMKHIDARN